MMQSKSLEMGAVLMREEWKDIKGYEGIYQISNKGEVRSLDRIVHGRNDYFQKGVILKQANNGNYNFVSIQVNGKQKKLYIHRAVAEHFIPNPLGLKEVNHKDENKQNNSVENLEWCTSKYNANYGTRNQRISEISKNNHAKQYVMYEYDGECHKLKDWARIYGMKYSLFYSRWRSGKRGSELFKGFERVKEVWNE